MKSVSEQSATPPTSWSIGPYQLQGKAVLAPMAGVSDFPFRKICLEHGAAMATAEMSASKAALRDTLKSQLRLTQAQDREPRTVQIVGTNPIELADAAQYQVEQGAQIVDINMGCPAKKVCNKAAGSALLGDEALVENILTAVVERVDVPVTLKIRTGINPEQVNATRIARIAEQCGIQALAVHGRTRACKFRGQAEYDTIASVVDAVSIPVIANGDIVSAEQAQLILKKTGATAVMVGRGAQGKPWLFSEINDLLNNSQQNCGLLTDKSLNLRGRMDLERLIINHIVEIHRFYDRALIDLSRNKTKRRRNSDDFSPELSVRVARKHVCWYFEQLEHRSNALTNENSSSSPEKRTTYETRKCSIKIPSREAASDQGSKDQAGTSVFRSARRSFNQLQLQSEQLAFIENFFADLRTTGVIAA